MSDYRAIETTVKTIEYGGGCPVEIVYNETPETRQPTYNCKHLKDGKLPRMVRIEGAEYIEQFCLDCLLDWIAANER